MVANNSGVYKILLIDCQLSTKGIGWGSGKCRNFLFGLRHETEQLLAFREMRKMKAQSVFDKTSSICLEMKHRYLIEKIHMCFNKLNQGIDNSADQVRYRSSLDMRSNMNLSNLSGNAPKSRVSSLSEGNRKMASLIFYNSHKKLLDIRLAKEPILKKGIEYFVLEKKNSIGFPFTINVQPRKAKKNKKFVILLEMSHKSTVNRFGSCKSIYLQIA